MLKVLIVEDDADARDALALLIASSGHELATAADGLQAISAAAEFLPDVVVCDWFLPGMDGVETARSIQAKSAVPFIFVTAHSIAELRGRTHDLDVRAYLSKPVDFVRLRSELATLEH